MKKKILTFLVAFVLIFTLASCEDEELNAIIDGLDTATVENAGDVTALETALATARGELEAAIAAGDTTATTALTDAIAELEAAIATANALTEGRIDAVEDAIDSKYSDGMYVPGTYIGEYATTEDDQSVVYYAIVVIDANGHVSGEFVDKFYSVENITEFAYGFSVDSVVYADWVDTAYYTYSSPFWGNTDYTGEYYTNLQLGNADYVFTDADGSGGATTGDTITYSGSNYYFGSFDSIVITLDSETTGTVAYYYGYTTDTSDAQTYGTATATVEVSTQYQSYVEVVSAALAEEEVTGDAADMAIANAIAQAEITDPNYEIIATSVEGAYTPGTYFIPLTNEENQSQNLGNSYGTNWNKTLEQYVSTSVSKYLNQYRGYAVVVVDEYGVVSGAQFVQFQSLFPEDGYNQEEGSSNWSRTFTGKSVEISSSVAAQASKTYSYGQYGSTTEEPVTISGDAYTVVYLEENDNGYTIPSAYTAIDHDGIYVNINKTDYIEWDATTESYVVYTWSDTGTVDENQNAIYDWAVNDSVTVLTITANTTSTTYSVAPINFEFFGWEDDFVAVANANGVYSTEYNFAAMHMYWTIAEPVITAE